MPESLDVLKLRVLLCFLNEEQKTCTVTGLAGVLGEGKQKVSRMLMALERHEHTADLLLPLPEHTGKARDRAGFLLFIEKAEQDAKLQNIQ